MTISGRPIGEDDLQAYVDGRLSPDRTATIEAYLRDYPHAAGRVASYRKQRDELRTMLRGKSEEPVPSRLRISAILAERLQARRRRLGAIAAACLWLVLGGTAGWFANGFVGPDMPLSSASARLSALTRDAVSAHRTFAVEIAHPVEVGADQQAHLARWIAIRLGHQLLIPDLSGAGLRLMGGRVLPAGHDAAAQLMYQDEHGLRVTFYIRAGESGETAFRFARHDDVMAYYWLDDGCAYVVSAAIDRDRLRKVAEAVFNQLEGPSGNPKPEL